MGEGGEQLRITGMGRGLWYGDWGDQKKGRMFREGGRVYFNAELQQDKVTIQSQEVGVTACKNRARRHSQPWRFWSVGWVVMDGGLVHQQSVVRTPLSVFPDLTERMNGLGCPVFCTCMTSKPLPGPVTTHTFPCPTPAFVKTPCPIGLPRIAAEEEV